MILDRKKIGIATVIFHVIAMSMFFFFPKEVTGNIYIWLPLSLIYIVLAYLLFKTKFTSNKSS